MPLAAKQASLDPMGIDCVMVDTLMGQEVHVVVEPEATRKQDHLGIPFAVILRIASEKYDRGEHRAGTLVVTADDIMG